MRHIILALALLFSPSLTGQTTQPPSVIEDRWYLVAASDDSACYTDVTTIKWDENIKCTTIWVRVYDRSKQIIAMMKWGYRNGGSEWAALAMNTYTPQMKLLSSATTKPWDIEWNAVVPNSYAHCVQQAASKFLQKLKNETPRESRI